MTPIPKSVSAAMLFSTIVWQVVFSRQNRSDAEAPPHLSADEKRAPPFGQRLRSARLVENFNNTATY